MADAIFLLARNAVLALTSGVKSDKPHVLGGSPTHATMVTSDEDIRKCDPKPSLFPYPNLPSGRLRSVFAASRWNGGSPCFQSVTAAMTKLLSPSGTRR